MFNVLVVPTVRENCIKEFLKAWRDSLADDWQQIVVIEDNPQKTFELNLKHHYSWQEIDDELGHDSIIISRKDSAIRSFGFWKAHQMGADNIFTLDDDCLPFGTEDGFCARHLSNFSLPRWTELIPNKRTRGLPYFNRGKLTNVVANIGLWCGCPDLDSVETLSKGQPTDFVPNCGDRVIPIGQYVPVCGMNLCFKREIAVLAYFPLMGENSPYRRFDDIWFGVIAKKICDHLGLLFTCGKPWVHHKKASDPITNLVKEAPGIAFNETFWDIVDRINLFGNDPSSCFVEVASSFGMEKDEYLRKLSDCMLKWANLGWDG